MFKLNFLRTLSAGAACLAMAGCCANSVCLCKDERADELAFSFQIGGPGGFAASDVDTLLVTRIINPNPAKNILASRETKLLTYALTPNGQDLVNNSFVINNAAPFASAGRTTKLNAYDYRIVAVRTDQVAGRKVVSRFVFKVDSIKLAGDYKAKGCCTCYENEGKRFEFNPVANDTSATSRTPKDVTAPVDAPIITVLKKS
ncbi:MAG TPA: hypothetical protein VFO93_13000 [Hymenobacter sp.]|uniref:hypothetical protein n=1 Tax=Hymenobacter sp. TaxID=1898978 RepID=UPI002D7FB54B|nr:hypothetical protein [Hymenobacter sp.]HET9504452.1 hypothetical protein [Hymenobacter sp.]